MEIAFVASSRSHSITCVDVGVGIHCPTVSTNILSSSVSVTKLSLLSNKKEMPK